MKTSKLFAAIPLTLAISTANAATLSMEITKMLAEGGDNSLFIKEAHRQPKTTVLSGDALIVPGQNFELNLFAKHKKQTRLSVATMLVNTNDAFVGTTLNLSSLALNEQVHYYLQVYDAGTEANSELAGTIPGPADGGEGFNLQRADSNRVSFHPGIVSQEDGYPESVLHSSHRFDSPVAMLSITRVF